MKNLLKSYGTSGIWMGAAPSREDADAADGGWVDSYGAAAEAVPDRGLLNPTGSNVCFLNSCLQLLFHLVPFRAALLSQSPHDHPTAILGEKCMTCAIKTVFTFYVYADEGAVPSDEARRALTLLDARLFPAGTMADASEALEKILASMHAEAVALQPLPRGHAVSRAGDPEDVTCSPACAAHSTFAMSYVSWWRCRRCGASTEPESSVASVYPVYVSEVSAALVALAKAQATLPAGSTKPLLRGLGGLPPQDRPGARVDLAGILSALAFEDMVAARNARSRGADKVAAAALNPHRAGDALCAGALHCFPERYCVHPPPVFLVSLRWPSEEASPQEVSHALGLVSQVRARPNARSRGLASQRPPPPRRSSWTSAASSSSSSSTPPMQRHQSGGRAAQQQRRRRPSSRRRTTCTACAALLPSTASTTLPLSVRRRPGEGGEPEPEVAWRSHRPSPHAPPPPPPCAASEARHEWLLLDDQRVLRVGEWRAVVDKCIRSRWQPTMLFYEQVTGAGAGGPRAVGGTVGGEGRDPRAAVPRPASLAASAAASASGGSATSGPSAASLLSQQSPRKPATSPLLQPSATAGANWEVARQ